MFPTLQIGPLAIQTPGLILLLAFYVGLTLSERFLRSVSASSGPEAGRGLEGLFPPPEALYALVTDALLAGVVGGRLIYVARYPQAFLQNPLSLFSLNPGLFDLWGGLAVAAVVALIYGQRKGLAFWPTLDALTPFFATLAVGIALAHLASGGAFGKPTDLPWGVELWGARRHPSQVYEAVAALGILGYVWWWGRGVAPSGVLFLRFVALTAGARLFLEAFRGDSILLAGGLRLAQVLAWLVLAIALAGLEYLHQREETK
ncbi:MAG: hypothetical protein D6770_10510 [Anaerolineae bacterium]|nr:MAG: hypothetical protein D6770_10510 [Anaerolineae bacterium]